MFRSEELQGHEWSSGKLPAAGNPTPYAAACLTKYRTASPRPGHARLVETDRQVAQKIHRQRRSRIACVVCVKGHRLLVSWPVTHSFSPEHGTTPGAETQRFTHTQFKVHSEPINRNIQQRSPICLLIHATNSSIPRDERFVWPMYTPGLNPDCRITCPTRHFGLLSINGFLQGRFQFVKYVE